MLPCAAAAALSWGDAGEEALTEVYNDGEEDAEQDGDGDADEGTCMQANAAVSVGHSGLAYMLVCAQGTLNSNVIRSQPRQDVTRDLRVHSRW